MSETSWRKIGPGAYVDGEHTLHLVADEMCAAAGVPVTDENIGRLALEAAAYVNEVDGCGIRLEADEEVVAAMIGGAPAFVSELARRASQERHPSYVVPLSTCPACGYAMDAATPGFGVGAPAEGDFSCCCRCGEMLVYEAGLTVRRITNAEITKLAEDEPALATALWTMAKSIIENTIR